MIIRVQSANGTKRIECSDREPTSQLFKKIQETFSLSDTSFCLYKGKNKKDEILSLERKPLHHYKLQHGDMIYLCELKTDDNATGESSLSCELLEDPVDTLLIKEDGCVDRPRDEKLCHHGANAKCVHCSAIEPYDEAYLRELNIKHLSFHSYLRKLMQGVTKGKYAALENVSCKIRPGCTEHAPWPQGICTKCQPNAITLNRQPYRHVDIVMFENPAIVDAFLNFWRTTGYQRVGFLYGKYEPHKDVPLGIKATVSAIYEPPQEGRMDAIRLLPDEKVQVVDSIAAALGLKRVGWIFTDLVAEDLVKGTVKHTRNSNSYFLSSQECIMAGHFQDLHPSFCRYSPDGKFGSKFATVCVTGDKDNNIHMEGYQVSNQCMALVRDNCLVPTKDAPELGYVKESSNEQYIPDVFYKEKDEYGNEVMQLARPMPMEYLLLDVPASTPKDPQFTFFVSDGVKPFPIENRAINGQIQDFNALSSYLRQFLPDRFLEAMSNFHVLIYLATMDLLPLKESLGPLLEAVKSKNAELAMQWTKSEQWQTVEQILAAEGPTPAATAPNTTNSSMWTCRHCTFLNPSGRANCDMCGLPQ